MKPSLRLSATGSLPVGALAVLLAVSGCATSEDVEPLPASAGGPLEFSHWQWLEPDRGDALWDAVSGYEAHNPDAELVQSSTPFASYPDNLNIEMGAGNGPDIFVVLDHQFVTLSEAGLLAPLGDVVEDAELNDTNDAALADGEYYGVTWEEVSYGLITNNALLDEAGVEPPTTVDELIEAGHAVQEETGAEGFGVRHQMNEFDAWYQDFASWVFGYGGEWSDGENLTLDSAENIEAVSEFKRVYDSGIMPVGDDASTIRNKFMEGQLAMMIDNSGAALSVTTEGQLGGSDIEASELPFPEYGAYQKLILAVNADSPRRELAEDFVRWFVTEEAQESLRTPIGAGQVATDVPLSDDWVEEHPWALGFQGDLAENARGNLVEGDEIRTKSIMRNFLQAVERVLTLDTDPAEALGEAQRDSQL